MSSRKRNENHDGSQKCEQALPTSEETAVWVGIHLAQRTVYKKIDAALKANELPPLVWYDILGIIQNAPDEGIQAYKMRQRLLFEQSNLSRLLRKLIEDGLLEERACPNDRRAKLLRITDKGRELRLKMWEIYGPLLHENMKKIPARNQPRMAELLAHLHGGWPMED